MAVATLAVRVSAQIAEFQKSFADATRTAEQFAGNFEGIATRAAAVGTFFGTIAADIASSIARGLGTAIKDAVKFSTEFNNAFVGLGSVARAFGTDTNQATAAAKQLSADGLLPLKDAATGLKNLLATGFSLDQAVQLMNAFKDSAAFGRQSSLSFGDAVRSATEGVKNANNALLDNVGLTKNGSAIMRDAGESVQAFGLLNTDAGFRSKFLAGALKETGAFAGDAAKLVNTYGGQLSRLTSQYNNALAAVGDIITQNRTVAEVLKFVANEFGRFTDSLKNNGEAFKFVSTLVIVFIKALSGVLSAVLLAQRAFTVLDNVMTLSVLTMALAVQKMLDLVIAVINVTTKLPGGSVAMAAFGTEIIAVAKASATVTRDVEAMRARIRDNHSTMVQWETTVGGLRNRMNSLATSLIFTTGQTVELGRAGERALGSGSSALPANLEKSAKAARGFQEAINKAASGLRLLTSLPGIKVDLAKLFPPLAEVPTIPIKLGIQGALPGLKADISNLAPELVGPFRAAFDQFGKQLPDIIFGTLQGGGSMVGAIAAGLAAVFAERFQKEVAAVGGDLSKLGFGGKALGTAGVGLSALTGGFGAGQQLGKGKGAAVGAGAGALAGLPLAGATMGISVAVGALAGAIGGWLGGAKKAREELEKLREAQRGIISEFGGMKNLTATANKLGISIGNALTTQKGAEFQRFVDQLNAALEVQQSRWEGMQKAITGVNAKAELFAGPFRKLLEAAGDETGNVSAKLAEMGQRGQAEFERLGVFVAATFAGLVRETGDAIGAIKELAPAFQALSDGVSKFGLEGTATINSLVGIFKLLTDEGTKPIFESLQATGQLFEGLQQGGLVTSEVFQAVGADIGASFRELEAKGVDMSQALALSQPILQRLWEVQQKFGAVTDETTAKILKQAEEAGLVGSHMKDVNERILDTLLDIKEIFGSMLPDAFKKAGAAAKIASSEIKDTLSNIRIPTIKVPFELEDQGGGGDEVRTSTGAELADRVVTTNVFLDGSRIAASTVRHIPRILNLHGV